MKKITRKVFLRKEDIDLIDKDINARNSYTLFANKEESTIELDITLSVPEVFTIDEDTLMTIIQGLTPALSEKEHEDRFNKVLTHLRSIGAGS